MWKICSLDHKKILVLGSFQKKRNLRRPKHLPSCLTWLMSILNVISSQEIFQRLSRCHARMGLMLGQTARTEVEWDTLLEEVVMLPLRKLPQNWDVETGVSFWWLSHWQILPSNSQHTPNLSTRSIFSPTLLALQVWNPRQPRVSVEEHEDLRPARTILNIHGQLLWDLHGSFLGYLLASSTTSYWGHTGHRASRKSLGLPALPEKLIWLTMHPGADSKKLSEERGKPTQASAMRILLTVCSSRSRPKAAISWQLPSFLDAAWDTWICPYAQDE